VIVEPTPTRRRRAKLAANAFSFAGQSCISVQRDLRRARRVRRVRRALRAAGRGARGRRPADEETDVGPVIDEDARERILEWIAESRRRAC
jgi:glyceraldehyde-3-phosphate dehydrogenase (NADP+)